MSKILNDGLDQYGAEPFEQQQYGTAGDEGVKSADNCIGQHNKCKNTVTCSSFVEFDSDPVYMLTNQAYHQVKELLYIMSTGIRWRFKKGQRPVVWCLNAKISEAGEPFENKNLRYRHAISLLHSHLA